MKLNSHIIIGDLDELVVSSKIIDDVLTRKLAYPVLYSQDLCLKENILYIAESCKLPENINYTGSPCLACVGQPPNFYYEQKINIIVVPSDTSIMTLFNKVLSIFNAYNEIQDYMQNIINRDLPIEEFSRIIEKVFHNPCCLSDRYSHVWFCSIPNEKFEEYYMRIGNDIYLSNEQINLLKMDEEYTHTIKNRIPGIYSACNYGFRTLYQNVFLSDQFYARLSIEEINKTFTDRDIALIYMMQEYLQFYLEKKNLKNFLVLDELDDVVIALIRDQLVSDKTIEESLSIKGWKMRDLYFSIFVEASANDIRNNTLIALSLQMSSLLPNIYSLVYENSIYILINLSKPIITKQDALKIILPTLRDNYFKAGISMSFEDFRDLRSYFCQSQKLIDIGKTIYPDFWYFDSANHILDFFITYAVGDLKPHAFYPEGLVRLIKYDDINGTEYVALLRTYLETNLSPLKSSKLLFMHRNTFLYRLDRIKELLGMNLDDYNERLLLSICLKLMQK